MIQKTRRRAENGAGQSDWGSERSEEFSLLDSHAGWDPSARLSVIGCLQTYPFIPVGLHHLKRPAGEDGEKQ
jgi:hypothetical protein